MACQTAPIEQKSRECSELPVALGRRWVAIFCARGTFELALYDALLSIDVPADKARAVIDALEHDMGSTLATKQDIRLLEQKLDLVQSSMTIRLGSILVVAMGLLFAALKLT